MPHVVKRKGHKEDFDERKVYASVYAASLNTHMTKGEAELIAEEVTKQVKAWVEGQEGVSSSQIFSRVVQELEHLNEEAAYMYTSHRDIS